jgi:hypothetical protein
VTVLRLVGVGSAAAWISAAAVVVAACVSPTIGGCPAIAPSALPEGSASLQARTTRDESGAEIAVWGQGANEVQQAARRLDAGEAQACAGQAVIFAGDCYPLNPPLLTVRGQRAVVFDGVSSSEGSSFDWVENGCVYEVRLPNTMPSQAVIDYAGRY